MQKYNPKEVESKWQKYWDTNQTFAASDDPEKEKFYALIEFPYPSGAGLHVGHPRPFTAMDVVSRKKRMEGKNVLYPIGFDAFGLPTENYAIKTGRPPAEVTAENIATFTRQLKSLGFGFDWSRVIDTTDPAYYKWTQWIFLQFFKAGFAYKKNQPINWCPKDKIGLANEEVVNGCCERCGTPVEARNKEQWMLAITKYADKLLQGLEQVNYIPEAKAQQQNWIGKSEGAEIDFILQGTDEKITVFTTRPDTLFGVTFVAVSAEQGKEWVGQGKISAPEIEKYISETLAARSAATAREEIEKTGIFSGLEAINPASGEKVPVWVTNYVLPGYGTGAVMGVPAHDERDFEFAKKYNLPVKQVIAPEFIENVNPPLPGKRTVRRKMVHAIISRKSDGAILMLEWKGAEWGSRPPHTFITGGIDAGEDMVEAATREIKEETGYENVRFVKDLGLEYHTRYHAAHKDENRYAENHTLYFEIDEDQKAGGIEEAESSKHDPVWIPRNKVGSFINVVDGPFEWKWFMSDGCALPESGIVINSGEFSGLSSEEAKKKITEKFGTPKTNYKLRDWVFSRQRYWGEPIPIIICDKCGYVPVPEDQLPLLLPKVDKYEPTDTGESPLSKIEEWVNVECPRCANLRKKEKYLVFDFDGVIGDTFAAALRARVASGYAKDELEAQEQFAKYFDKKPHHTKDHVLTPEQMKEDLVFTEKFGTAMSREGFGLFEEFVEEVKKIPEATIAIVSSGSKLYIEDKVASSGLVPTHVLTFEDHHSKEEKIETICKAWGVGLKDIFYFTDTKADVYELENCLDRSNIIGCAWGYHGFEKLQEVLPENQILKNFEDIHSVFTTGKARRETDTMPNWAGSSWYWLRYMDPHNDIAFAAPEKLEYWAPVDWYNGGNEHTVLHLLYSRFWNQFLFDQGLVPTLEPYKKRTSHGIILAEDGEKMSKSRGNVVNPDDIVDQFGADALRTYIILMGAFDQAVSWSTNGVLGVYRFLEKVWNLQDKLAKTEEGIPDEQFKLAHRLVAKVSSDIDEMKFNTAVAKMMETMNELSRFESISKEVYAMIVKVLAPFAPHMAEELWSTVLTGEGSVSRASWPTAESKWLVDDTFTLVIQVNGKVRDEIIVAKDLAEEEVKKRALSTEKIIAKLEGKEPKKVIYVKGKLVSIVV